MSKKTKIILSVVLCVALIAGGWLYIDYKMYCKTYFPNNTIINGIDCSGMTTKVAKKALTEEWNKHDFKVTQDGKEVATITGLDLVYDIDAQLQKLMDNGYRFPLFTLLSNGNQDLTISMMPKELTSGINEQINALPIYEQAEPVQTTNAYIDMSNNQFTIVPEVYGNNIDKKVVKQVIKERISCGSWELPFVEEDFYEQPTITKDSEELLAEQTYCKTYLAHQITYTFGPESQTITPAELKEMMSADKDGKITVAQKAVEKFVSALAATRNTVDTVRSFKSTSRGYVTIYGGTYGYTIDEEKEIAQLTKDLKGLKNVSREPVYAQEGWGWENDGFGSTYIEVDLALQRLWYYQNGEILLTCPIVSGCVATKHYTATGAYQIVYMARDVVLKGGSKKKKTYYESHVDYWMPFYADYGLHDADWRSSFGGSIYLRDGSHGCVNMPPASAAQLYNLVSTGTPVIVFN